MQTLTEDEKAQGFFIRGGQKTTPAIEQLCEESVHASAQTARNQYF